MKVTAPPGVRENGAGQAGGRDQHWPQRRPIEAAVNEKAGGGRVYDADRRDFGCRRNTFDNRCSN